MSRAVLLDAGPLGLASHPKSTPRGVACVGWLQSLIQAGTRVIIPEIADYEVRRELLRARKIAGLARLDLLKQTLTYAPLTTSVMLKAAACWAQARQIGKPTADDKRLDADMIISAQAVLFRDAGHDVIVATDNTAHLSLFVPAARWQDIN